MARSLNRTQLLGNLGQDPEIRSTPQGSSICNLNVATTESYKDKTSGEWKEITDWHRVVLWDYLADTAAKYLKKGSKVFIEGKLKTRTYEKDGSQRYMTEVVGSTLIILDRREQSEGSYSGGGYSAPDTASAPDEDDIPF